MQYSKSYSTKKTAQNQKIPGPKGENQVKNNAGGFVFGIDEFKKLDRFLILGTEGGSYYVNQHNLTIENANNVVECIKKDGEKVVNRVIEISQEGRAPKNDPAIFTIALACTFGDEKTKKLAYDNITNVCRTGTHLFQFMQSVKDMRGFSRGLRRGISKYYTDRPVNNLAFQLVKYRQRAGWTHKDVLALTHPKIKEENKNELIRWAVGNEKRQANKEKLHPIINAFEEINKLNEKDVKRAVEIITEHRLPLECVPTYFQKDKKIWEAVLPNLMIIALTRNLGRMTACGLLENALQTETKDIICKLTDAGQIKRSKIHPLQVLLALKTYEQGCGFRGSLSWNPIPQIVDALNEAFYMSFKNVEPTNKSFYLGIDVSGSMSSTIMNTNISNAEAAAALAMVTARTEKNYECRGFTSASGDYFSRNTLMTDLGITPNMRLDDVMRTTNRRNFGATDCSLPMIHAKKQKMDVDCFIVYTDNETWHGKTHPCQALEDYRQFIGHQAKLIVAAFSTSEFSIADPNDSNSLDIVGFDAAIPSVIRSFVTE